MKWVNIFPIIIDQFRINAPFYYQGLKQVYSMATESCQISTMTSFAKIVNPLSANITKWSNVLKQFVGKLPTNCLSVFDPFVGLALKGLNNYE